MFNLREACDYAGTIVKSIEHGWDLALRPNYPLLHSNQTSAPSVPSLTPTGNASRYSPLHIPPLKLQLQYKQEGPRWHLLLSMDTIVRYEILGVQPGSNNTSPMHKPDCNYLTTQGSSINLNASKFPKTKPTTEFTLLCHPKEHCSTYM